MTKPAPLPKPKHTVKMPEGVPWPEHAPILKAEHMCRGKPFKKGDPHCACLLGHAYMLAGHVTRDADGRVQYTEAGLQGGSLERARTDVIVTALRYRIAAFTDVSERRDAVAHVAAFNDGKPVYHYLAPTYETLARIWNATMADLGYTEGNPEA